MSLFNQILGAIANPAQEASPSQLTSILYTVKQLSSSYQTNPDTVQSALSVVSKYTRTALQEKKQVGGETQVQNIINEFAGTQASPQAIETLFARGQISDLISQVESQTGLNPGVIQGMLPVLVPLVLKFLKTGNQTNNPLGSNPLVQQFLDADRDGDVDIADALSLASRYLK
ncbi:MAG: DUF937 domain-containing protein [Cyanobacteria bacterium J083]|nr:MAG: DUF937 domain-containing protein [Cyanobacteria bacterium J083]